MSHNTSRRGRKLEPPTDVTPVMKPRSNSIGLLAGSVVSVSLMVAADHWEIGSRNQKFAGLAFVPLAIALAELRSGYAWRNMTPGNRGVSRSESPRRYWFLVAEHLLIACGVILFGWLAT